MWVIVILALPLAAAAQPSSKIRADALVIEAEAAAQANDFLGAARKYRAAHALDPRPELLCNVGVAYHKAKDLPRAQLLLGQCLTRGASLEASFVEAVRAAQAQTEQALREGQFGTVEVVVAPEGTAFTVSAFGPDETIVGSRLLWLPFGTHKLTFRAGGHIDQTEEVVIDTKNEIKLRVTLEPRPVVKPRSRGPAVAATVATGVLGAAAVGSYLIARDKASQAGSTEISLSEYDSLTSSARTWQKMSWGFAGAAAVGAVVSGYLWIRARSAPSVRVEAAPTAGGAAVWITGEL